MPMRRYTLTLNFFASSNTVFTDPSSSRISPSSNSSFILTSAMASSSVLELAAAASDDRVAVDIVLC